MPVIALGGIKHTGKSTVGRIVSELKSLDFKDLDDLILPLLPHSWSIRRWYREKGARAFMEVEQNALRDFLSTEDPARLKILALGGGTLENPGALKLLKDSKTRILVLNEEENVLYKRIILKGIPPFLDSENPESSFSELYKKRKQTLLREGDFIININGLDQYQAAEEVIRYIRSTYGG